jgi:hypothetical protein
MNTDETGFFAGPPSDRTRTPASVPSFRELVITRRQFVLRRIQIAIGKRVLAGVALTGFCYVQCRDWWYAWYLRYKYDPPKSLGPLYFLTNASTADDWIGYTLLVVVSLCFAAFLVWPNRWTALLVCAVVLPWSIAGCEDETTRAFPWRDRGYWRTG